MDRLNKTTKENGMKINTKKMKVMKISRVVEDKNRVRPNIGFGYGYGAETATFLGFGLVTVTAVIEI